MNDTLPLWLQTTVAVATVGASCAAAVGAIAAWRAASASRATSRDAQEALALAIQPNVTASPTYVGPEPSRYMARVSNTSDFDASDVDVEVHRADGQVYRHHFERVPASHGHEVGSAELRFPIGEKPTYDQPADPTLVVVRYSDARGIGRYEFKAVQTARSDSMTSGVSYSPSTERLR